MIVSNDDQRRTALLLAPTTSLGDIAAAVKDREGGDDITRALWFHANAFRGIDREIQDVTETLDALGDLSRARTLGLPWGAGDRSEDPRQERKTRAERALHRLVLLGVVADYTVDWSALEFGVRLNGADADDVIEAYRRYVNGYSSRLAEREIERLSPVSRQDTRTFVLAAARQLVEFVYAHIEKGRRKSLSTMLEAVTTSRSGADLRRRILEYLQQSEWDERLDEMRTSEDDVLAGIAKLLDDIVSPNDASELRGAADRMLASYPDVPGILLARAAAEAFCRDSVLEVVERNVKAGWRFAEREYGIEFGILSNAVLWLTKVLYEKGRTDAAEAVVRASTDATKNPRALARLCVSGLPDRLAAGPAEFLVTQALVETKRSLDVLGA